MKVTLLLGDSARVAEGKLDVLGAGWTVSGPAPINFGIGVLFEVPWAELGSEHNVEIVLLDDRGQVVENENHEPMFRVDGRVNANKPPGVLLGTPVVVPMAMNFVGVPVPPGGRYKFALLVDGHANVDCEAAFDMRPPMPPAPA